MTGGLHRRHLCVPSNARADAYKPWLEPRRSPAGKTILTSEALRSRSELSQWEEFCLSRARVVKLVYVDHLRVPVIRQWFALERVVGMLLLPAALSACDFRITDRLAMSQ